MSNIFINSGGQTRINCQDWNKFQTKVGLRGENFRFIILALGNIGSGKTDAIKFAKQYASLINPSVIRDNKFTSADNTTKSWVDIEVSYDNVIINNQNYKDCINGILEKHHDSENDGEDIINNSETINNMGNCYSKYRTGQTIANQATIRRAYGFSNTSQRGRYSKPPQAIKRRDDATERKRKWGESIIGKTLHEHELDKFVEPGAPLNQRPQEVFNADIVVYKKLTQSVKDGRNIVYEATGKSFDTIKQIIKLASNSCSINRYNYIIMCIVNIIDKEDNQERVKARFKTALGRYKDNKANPAPRLPLQTLDAIDADQNILKKNIIELIEQCTCEKKEKWQEKMEMDAKTGKMVGTGDFVTKNVKVQKKYGQCSGVGIDLLMLFDQQYIDLRKVSKDVYPSAIIPLSTRAVYLLPLTRTGEGTITFNANEKKKTELLLGKICAGTTQLPEEIGDPEENKQEEEQLRIQATQKKDQLKIEADRIEYRKKLRQKVREKRANRGGKKTRRKKRRKKRRKTRRKRKRRKTRKN